jgi:hypothetical protein
MVSPSKPSDQMATRHVKYSVMEIEVRTAGNCYRRNEDQDHDHRYADQPD